MSFFYWSVRLVAGICVVQSLFWRSFYRGLNISFVRFAVSEGRRGENGEPRTPPKMPETRRGPRVLRNTLAKMALDLARKAARNNPAPRVPLHHPERGSEPSVSPPSRWNLLDPCPPELHRPDLGRQAGTIPVSHPNLPALAAVRSQSRPAPSLLPRSVDAPPFASRRWG